VNSGDDLGYAMVWVGTGLGTEYTGQYGRSEVAC
jgi:hypothetical protein